MLKKAILFVIMTFTATLACQSVSRFPALVFGTATPIFYTSTPAFTPTPQPAPLSELAYSDRPDEDPEKWQIHVLYVVPKGFTDTTRYFDGSIDESMRLVNEWFMDQTDGQSLALDTYQGGLDITYIPLPATDDEIVEAARGKYEGRIGDGAFDPFFDVLTRHILQMRAAQGLSFRSRKIYVTYIEISESHTCGVSGGELDNSGSTQFAMVFPSAYDLRDNLECVLAANETLDGKRGLWEYILAHELIHLMGPRNFACSPNSIDEHLHIYDPEAPDDIMGIGLYSENPVLDPNHNDYYMTGECFDLANSAYLYP